MLMRYAVTESGSRTRRIVAVLLGLLCAGGSLLLGELGFQRVLDFRTLERIPATSITGSVGGETQLIGQARSSGRLLQAPKSGTDTLYYRYLVEREERDSDGNKSWKTITDQSEATDFILQDASGTLLIAAQRDSALIDWSVGRKFRVREGDLRYTEWRIDESDKLTVFGWLDLDPEPVMRFSVAGQYLPIISSGSAGDERAELGTLAVLMLWGAITLLILACLATVYALRIHRTLVFLVFVSASSMLLLVNYGARSLASDISEGYQRVVTQAERASNLIATSLRPYGVTFAGLEEPLAIDTPGFAGVPQMQRDQIAAWQQSSWLVRERYLQQINRFPENLYARLTGKHQPAPVVLSEAGAAKASAELARFQQTQLAGYYYLTLPALLITGLIAWFAFNSIRVKRMQENLATSKTIGVVYGLTEVEGELEADDPAKLLRGPVSNDACVWYRYVVEERRGTGKNTKWVTIEDRTEKRPFFCRDSEGKIRVFPGQADIMTHHRSTRREGNRRYSETSLQPGDTLYILAHARQDKTRGDSLVLGHEKGSPYIIANVPEAEVMFRKAFTGQALLSAGASLLFLVAVWMGGSNGDFSSLDFVLAALIAPAFLTMVVVMLMYNDLVFLRQRCDRNWANIQVSLKKRATLVPQLVQVAKEYLAFEEELQQDLAELRATIGSADTAAMVDQVMALEHRSIERMSLTIEAYPDLKAATIMADLNRRLIALENEIAMIRAGFNDAVMQYNTRTRSFPDNLLARIFRFPSINMLSFEARAHAIPPVKDLLQN
ncbi:MAG: LemA family protein [Pseudomonadota bacterium]